MAPKPKKKRAEHYHFTISEDFAEATEAINEWAGKGEVLAHKYAEAIIKLRREERHAEFLAANNGLSPNEAFLCAPTRNLGVDGFSKDSLYSLPSMYTFLEYKHVDGLEPRDLFRLRKCLDYNSQLVSGVIRDFSLSYQEREQLMKETEIELDQRRRSKAEKEEQERVIRDIKSKEAFEHGATTVSATTIQQQRPKVVNSLDEIFSGPQQEQQQAEQSNG